MGSDGFSLLGERMRKGKKLRRISLILSLIIPGLGHIIRGRIAMGVAALILDASFLAFITIMNRLRPDLGWLLWPLWSVTFAIYYFLTAYDAYRGPRLEEAPCRRDCPAGLNVPDYISLVAAGRYDEADALIRLKAPLAGILGRICPAPCEEVCTRTRIEEPIAIRALKRSAATNSSEKKILPSAVLYSKHKVAVVGAGPSGLTCAHFLAQRGYSVDLFDKESKPGGILRDIIPCFRLPQEVVQSDIDFIMNSNPGIKLFPNQALGEELSLRKLEASYDAVYLALGASRPRPLMIEGEGLEGVISGLSFLREVCIGKTKSLSGHVAVLGGGNTAVDSARAALRMGAKKVTIFYRRMRVNMPAYKEEIEEAEKEGVGLHFLASPIKFEGKKRVENIVFSRMTLSDLKSGRRSELIPVHGEQWIEDVNTVIVAVGQEPDIKLLGTLGLLTDIDGKIKVNRKLATSRRKVFAGGDCVLGPSAVVEAVRDGRRAAESIDYFLRPRLFSANIARMFEFEPGFGLDRLEGSAWSVRNPGFESRRKEASDFEKLSMAKEVMCGFAKGDDEDEAKRCLACHKHNPGFLYKTGKQKGYVAQDER